MGEPVGRWGTAGGGRGKFGGKPLSPVVLLILKLLLIFFFFLLGIRFFINVHFHFSRLYKK
jgi:hypothetical protein